MNCLSQLTAILVRADWTQERLARELHVSFATLNSWVNERSQPRAKARLGIEKLYFDIVGVSTVNDGELKAAKAAALKFRTSAKAITDDAAKLDTLSLYLTYHTNTIEGSTMTLDDVEEVLFEHKVLSNRTAVEQAEARNHQSALLWLLDRLVAEGKEFVIDEALLLEIHLRLMNGIISDAGQYRRHAVRIMGAHVALASWAKIPERIAELTAALQHPPQDIVKALAITHARFEQIHPFTDGNGRTGRLLLLAQALQAGRLPPLVVKERKHAYYKYLELAQTQEDYRPLELFIADSMRFTHELLEK